MTYTGKVAFKEISLFKVIFAPNETFTGRAQGYVPKSAKSRRFHSSP
jgi:hypothetical protein